MTDVLNEEMNVATPIAGVDPPLGAPVRRVPKDEEIIKKLAGNLSKKILKEMADYDSLDLNEMRDWSESSCVGLEKEDAALRQSKTHAHNWNIQPADRVHYKIPFAQKDVAKNAGMKFDPDKKTWYHHKDKAPPASLHRYKL